MKKQEAKQLPRAVDLMRQIRERRNGLRRPARLMKLAERSRNQALSQIRKAFQTNNLIPTQPVFTRVQAPNASGKFGSRVVWASSIQGTKRGSFSRGVR